MADLLQILGSVEQQRRQELYNIAQPQINMLKQDIAMQEQRNLIKEEKINEIQSLGGTYDENTDIDIQLGNVRRNRADLDRETVAKEKYEMTFGEQAPEGNIFQLFGQKTKNVTEEKTNKIKEERLQDYKNKILSEYTPDEIKEAGVNINEKPYEANAILQRNRKLADIDRLVEKKNASLLKLTAKEKETISLFKNDVTQITNIFNGLINTKFARKNSDLIKDIQTKLENNESIDKTSATRMINAYLDEQKISDEDRAVLFGDYYANVIGYNQNVDWYNKKSEELNNKGEDLNNKGEGESKNIEQITKSYYKDNMRKVNKFISEYRKIVGDEYVDRKKIIIMMKAYEQQGKSIDDLKKDLLNEKETN